MKKFEMMPTVELEQLIQACLPPYWKRCRRTAGRRYFGACRNDQTSLP